MQLKLRLINMSKADRTEIHFITFDRITREGREIEVPLPVGGKPYIVLNGKEYVIVDRTKQQIIDYGESI